MKTYLVLCGTKQESKELYDFNNPSHTSIKADHKVIIRLKNF
jgi:hypothetical protein